MEIKTAKICLDCECLFEGDQCPRCASRAWMWLRRITGDVATERIDREPKYAAQPV